MTREAKQKELDRRWDHGFRSGYEKGVKEGRMAMLKDIRTLLGIDEFVASELWQHINSDHS